MEPSHSMLRGKQLQGALTAQQITRLSLKFPLHEATGALANNYFAKTINEAKRFVTTQALCYFKSLHVHPGGVCGTTCYLCLRHTSISTASAAWHVWSRRCRTTISTTSAARHKCSILCLPHCIYGHSILLNCTYV